MVDTGNGQQSIVYGVIVNHYDPVRRARPSRRNPTLAQATTDLVRQIRESNTHLRPARGAAGRPRETVDGAPGMSRVLSGVSPITGEEERVTAGDPADGATGTCSTRC